MKNVSKFERGFRLGDKVKLVSDEGPVFTIVSLESVLYEDEDYISIAYFNNDNDIFIVDMNKNVLKLAE